MPVWLEIVLVNLCIGLALYARGVFVELKSTKEQLEMVKDINKRLNEKLKIANQKNAKSNGRDCENTTKNTKIPGFLLADDPMDELLRSVGRLEK